MAQVRNTATGQTLTIPDDQVPFMSSQWQVVGSSPTPTTTPTPTPAAPTQSSGNNVTIYYQNRDGSVASNIVPRGDLSYYLGQGWTSAPPSQSSTPTPTPAPAPAPTSSLGDKFDETAKEMEKAGDLEGMSDEQKTLAVAQQMGITAITAEDKALAEQYLAQAKELADPYYRSMVNVALDELSRTAESGAKDLEYKKTQIETKIKELQEDLAYNKEKLSLDEQAEMSQQLASYESERENVDLQMQEAGLTFSSPRKVAEQRLKSSQDLTAQSTARKYATARREQELGVSRSAAALQQEGLLAERQAQEALTSATRATEAKVGSAALPSSADALGGVSGSIEDARKSAILNLSDVIATRKGEIPTF